MIQEATRLDEHKREVDVFKIKIGRQKTVDCIKAFKDECLDRVDFIYKQCRDVSIKLQSDTMMDSLAEFEHSMRAIKNINTKELWYCGKTSGKGVKALEKEITSKQKESIEAERREQKRLAALV